MKKPNNRFFAAFYHLLLSALLIGSVATIILLVWYPWPFSQISGGLHLLALVASVDIVLGPLLTLVIYDIRKPQRQLRRDILLILLIQCAGLAYGLVSVYLARPVVVAFDGLQFKTVAAVDVAEAELAQALAPFQALPLNGPRFVGLRAASNAEKFDVFAQALAGRDSSARPLFWQSYAASKTAVLAAAKPLSSLYQKYPDSRAEIARAITASGRASAQLVYLPIVAKDGSWTVLLDADSAMPLAYVEKDGF
ncbi:MULTISPECIES: TfpX/TfpZ family type IV pilin accessory protein [unclassified Undibacterium]|uniref:TfpX/TfpZ family type IV pilin accessory protein n=1 Tax=unclassified Undibacterium TaxID=2630295 RepID=UPI002AC972CF|nr:MULTISPECIES: TfpX/TfpZ family type IV pilin accessory protein [unclassified Undibacterium]MEB0139357.1 TfpX/TfpZ family type IV pilin accessory protein [Undibacterium sp. CCC2.1]MEB0173378.1 TfpX/TfpZ family type IV pilin accessory protein [Undibacterium sp. CCC1.1]MEB0177235.1 TfpX/TfpZ family type IV pilin accessory protein [Undibacterium sp. CCC3.4]MEB0216500.1 TfpX/TfpZ family type IV pilin accessory protein [Undibacterium sp. 5I2]WPX44070.1 TfpX/TfpZ family type IV pilin accessory pro